MQPRILHPAWIAGLAAAALGAAFVAQYGFGLEPCILCLYQRVPFYLTVALGLVALLPGLGGRARAALLALAGAALVVNAGIAFYHVGVEKHWWAGTSACGGGSAGGLGAMSMEEMMQAMSRPVEARCDEPAWSFLGITMAAMNVPFSLAFGLATLWAAGRLAHERR